MENQATTLIIVTGIIDRPQWLSAGSEDGDAKSYNGPLCFLTKAFPSLRISVFHTVDRYPNDEERDTIIDLPDIKQRSVDLLHFVDREHRQGDLVTPPAGSPGQPGDGSSGVPPVLIFAGHDLGGIVVKQLFVETPHYAPDHHAWERTILRMLSLVRDANLDFVSFFKYLPAFASRVEEEFRDVLGSLPVINFYTKASPLRFVTKETDDLLRFTGYNKTELLECDIAESWSIREHESAAETIRKIIATANDGDIKKLLLCLAEVAPKVRALRSFVDSTVSSAFHDWIWKTEWYGDWVANTGDSVLHIASPSGSGTTALASNIVRRLRRNGAIVLGFSTLSVPEHVRNDGEASSAILFSALCQLLLQQAARKGFTPSYLSFYLRLREELFLTKTVLRGLLSSLLSSQDSGSPIFCVIHGIHLLPDGGQKQLFRDLDTIMASSQSSFKLLITTDGQPPWQTMPELRSGVSVQLQEAQDNHDVKTRFSAARIEHIARSRPVWRLSKPNLKNMLITKLCAESATMLELSLKLDLIELTDTPETTSDVESMISDLPPSLTKTIDTIFQPCAHLHSVVSTALKWILSSSRPLSLLELSVCVGLGTGPAQPNGCGALRERISWNPSRDLQRALGPVIDVSDDTVRLRHHSLAKVLRGRQYFQMASDPHCVLLSECLGYLQLVADAWNASTPEREDSEDSRELLLVEYAAVHWPTHGFLSDDQEKATSIIFDFLQSTFFDTWAAMLRYYCTPAAPLQRKAAVTRLPRSSVEAACYFGFLGVVDKFLEQTPLSEPLRKDLTTGLDFAAERGHVSIVQRILDKGIRSNEVSRIAARFGQSSVLEALVVSSALDIESKDEAGFDPLLEGCRGGHLGVVKLLMQQGANVKTTNVGGLTPLHLACRTGQAEVVDELITSGYAPVNSKDGSGYTPLMYAAEGGFQHIVRNLISKLTETHSDPEDEWSLETELDQNTSEGNTALHLATSSGHLKMVDLLLQRGASPTKENEVGYTPLHLAAKLGLLEVAKLLIKASQEAASQEDDVTTMSRSSQVDADSPIKLAVANRHLGVVRELLRSQQHRSPESAFRAVLHACKAGYLDTAIDILDWYREAEELDRSSPALRDEDGTTALHLGAQFKHLKLVEDILTRSLVPVNAPDKQGWTPLHTAARYGDDEIIKTLLDWEAAALSKTVDGLTALHLAARHGHAGACTVLGNKCEDLLRIKTKDGDIPVFLAAKEGHTDAVYALLRFAPETGREGLLHLAVESGSQELLEIVLDTKPDLDWVDSDGDTAVHLAVSGGHISMMQSLHKAGANMTKKDGKGKTPLFRAVEEENVAMVKALSDLDADLDADQPDEEGLTPLLTICASETFFDEPDIVVEIARVLLTKYGGKVNINVTHPNSGKTPLHFSTDSDSEDLTMLLLEHNADPNIRNKRGSTPIFLAAELGKLKSVETLIRHEAEASIRNGSNTTPLHRAAGNNHAECVKLLLKHGAGADLNHKSDFGYTPLALAAVNGYTETAKTLLENDADWNIENDDGLSPLGIAAEAEEEDTVDELLKAMASKPSDIHHTIRRAAVNGHADVVDMLVRKIDEPNIDEETHGSILGLAIAREQYDVATILLDVPGINANIRDAVWRTPLFMAVEKEKPELVQALTEVGADPNTKDREDHWPLSHAITKHSTEMVEHLLSLKNIDLAVVDGRGYGTLYWACRRGTDEIFTLIHEAVKKHPDYDTMRQSAIHGAVASDNHFAFDALAESGVDFNKPDPDGWTLLYTARCYELPSMEEKLIEKGAKNDARPTNIKTPTAWHSTDKGVGLSRDEASPNIIVVEEITRQMSGDFFRYCVARADHPLPGDEDWYFEVTVQKGYDDEEDAQPLGVGIAEDNTDRWQLLGLRNDGEGQSYGFHADDGYTYPQDQAKESDAKELYGQGDTIGCGYVRRKKAVYYTRKGERLGLAFEDVKGKFYPAVFMLARQVGVSISANFMNSPPWMFDLKSPRLLPSRPPEQQSSGEDSSRTGSPKSAGGDSLYNSDDDE
ncbi:hypothetical protein MFIFM68171_08162 [Madurella fahalii]|uniref:protein S-acyltransferase n=1 Tax=Madurella fahalii TaxID=1157608 RepID=A0ABQ0GJP2_9PEZI